MRKMILIPTLLVAALSLPFAALAAGHTTAAHSKTAAVKPAEPAEKAAEPVATEGSKKAVVAHESAKKPGGVCLTCSVSKKKQS
jgi:hypothetical protein